MGSMATITALKAHHAVVIATGSTPTIPDIEGLIDVPFWTTRGATAAKEVPKRFVVLGGGVAGVEMAQAFARLGSDVTLIARGRLLSNYPEEAAALVLAGLRADGVAVHVHTDVQRVGKNDDGSVTVTLDDTVAHGGPTPGRLRKTPRPGQSGPGKCGGRSAGR